MVKVPARYILPMIAFRDALCITHNPVNGTVSQCRERPARFAGCRITQRTPAGIIRKAALCPFRCCRHRGGPGLDLRLIGVWGRAYARGWRTFVPSEPRTYGRGRLARGDGRAGRGARGRAYARGWRTFVPSEPRTYGRGRLARGDGRAGRGARGRAYARGWRTFVPSEPRTYGRGRLARGDGRAGRGARGRAYARGWRTFVPSEPRTYGRGRRCGRGRWAGRTRRSGSGLRPRLEDIRPV